MSDPGKVGLKAEERALGRTGFRRVRGSGSWDGAKGDGERGEFLKEVKSTQKQSFSLRLDVLQKIALEARQSGRRPVLEVLFTDGTGRPRRDGAWVMIREDEWRELLDAADDA